MAILQPLTTSFRFYIFASGLRSARRPAACCRKRSRLSPDFIAWSDGGDVLSGLFHCLIFSRTAVSRSLWAAARPADQVGGQAQRQAEGPAAGPLGARSLAVASGPDPRADRRLQYPGRLTAPALPQDAPATL